MDPDQTRHRSTSDESHFSLSAGQETEPAHFGRSFVGQTLGEYRVEREIGRGSMGIVYEATHIRLKRVVALKVLPPSLSITETVIRRFLREAESVARLSHPNIVRIFEIGTDDSVHFYAMQLIEGTPLDQALRERKLSARECAKIAADSAKALFYAHENGIIHRDVKPANIILSHKDMPVLTDFGLARPEKAATLTESGALVGTPIYMSPEQVRGERTEIDRRTDIYSLGVTLYEMLTGETPFIGKSTQEILRKIELEDPTPVRKIRGDVPRPLETICHRAMEKDPARRFVSAEALSLDLERFLRGEPIHARPISTSSRIVRKARQHPVIAWMTALLLLSAGIIFAVSVNNRNNLDRARLAREAQREAEDARRESRYEQLVSEGASLLRQDRAAAAVLCLDEAIGLGFQRSEAFVERGKCHYDLEAYNSALGDFEQACQVNPGDFRARIWRGITKCNYGDSRQRDEGIADIRETLDANPDDPECLLEASKLHLDFARDATLSVARDQFLNAGFSRIKRTIELMEAFNRQEYDALFVRTGEHDESLLVRGLDQALVIQGLLYEAQDMPELAASNYERATKINKSNALAWTLWRSDRGTDANNDPEPEEENAEPTVPMPSWMAVLAREGLAWSREVSWDREFSRRAADALSLFPRGGRVDPGRNSIPLSPDAIEDAMTTANQLWQDGEHDQALPYYRVVSENNPQLAEPFHRLAEYYLIDAHDTTLAREHLERAREIAPAHPVTLYLALRIYGLQRDREKMREVWETVTRFYPAVLAMPGIDTGWFEDSADAESKPIEPPPDREANGNDRQGRPA